MNKLKTFIDEFGSLLPPLLVLFMINHFFNFELSFFSQPVYGYDFSGRLMGVVQLSLSTVFNYKPIPPTPLFQQLPLYYFIRVDARLHVLLLWFSSSIVFVLSNRPRSTFQSSSIFLFFITSIFLWGLNTKHQYTWHLLTILQSTPLIMYIAGYVLAVLTMGFTAFTIEATLLRRRKIQEAEEEKIKVTCPKCGAEFRSNPIYCSYCGFHINKAEE